MDEIDFTQAILRLIRERRFDVIETLECNGVKNMEHYNRLMGVLDGINFVEQELKVLLEKQEHSDD
tara:strand:- start:234 stop:431 length:198 start_codon:yes stop_codon:yes gene_type:complete